MLFGNHGRVKKKKINKKIKTTSLRLSNAAISHVITELVVVDLKHLV